MEFEARLSTPWQVEGLALPTGVRLSERSESSLRFRVEQPQKSNPELLHQLAKSRVPVMTLQEVPRSLEQVYLKAMAEAQLTPRDFFREKDLK